MIKWKKTTIFVAYCYTGTLLVCLKSCGNLAPLMFAKIMFEKSQSNFSIAERTW